MNEKVTFWKIAIMGVFVFLFGYFVGNIFDIKRIKTINLEGYEYDALASIDATTSNATTSNATTSNATTSNATTSNVKPCTATTSNATSSNITSNNTQNSTSTTTNTNNNNTTTTNTNTSNQININENISFENNKITAAQIKEISDLNKPLNVTLNCDSNSVVSSSMFEAIKKSNSNLTLVYGKNKMTFLGTSITQPKDINFTVSLSEINKNEELNKFTDSGLVIEFPNNNNLPGTALVSVNIDSQYSSCFSSGVVSLYYYNESTSRLELVADNLKITNNTVEFTISHNSSYVLTSSVINQNNNTEETSNAVVKFVNNKLIYLIVIGVSVVLIIAVTIIILVQRKKKLGKMI